MNGFRGPFYYLLLGVSAAIFGDAFTVGKLLSVLGAAAGIRIVGELLRRLWNPMTGFCGALFLAASPTYLEFSFRASTDMVFFPLFVGSILLLLGPERPTARHWMAAGILAGAAWLTRYNGLALVPGALAVAVLVLRPPARSARLFGGFLAAWLVVMLPWSLFLWSRTGDPFWNNNYQNVAIEVYTSHPGMAQQGRFMGDVGFASLAEVWAVQPLRFLRAMGQNLIEHFWGDVRQLVGIPWAVVAVLGIAVGWRSWLRRRNLAFVAVLILTYLALLPVFYSPRFMIPLLPWWAAGVGGAGAFVGERLNRRFSSAKRKRSEEEVAFVTAGGRIVSAILLVSVIWATQAEIRQSLDPQGNKASPVELLDVARQAGGTGQPFGPATPVAARKPHLGYYLGAPTVAIPFGGMKELQASGARYLLVSGAEANAAFSLQPLVYVTDPTKIPSGLKLVTRTARRVTKEIYRAASLYEVENPGPWSPPKREFVPPSRETLPGFSRLDHLRYRLAHWYLVWEPAVKVEPLVRLMAEETQKRPRVLEIQGDEALKERRFSDAKALYGESLRAEPGRESAILRLAGAFYLEGNLQAYENTLRQYVTLRRASEVSAAWWLQAARDPAAFGDHAAAVAPLAACVTADPKAAPCLRRLGEALIGLDYIEEGLEFLSRYLELQPDDAGVAEIVRRREQP
jgi:hypothetical protein